MPMRGVAQTMVLEASTLFDDDNGTSLTTLDALSHMQQVRSEYVISPHTCAARPTPAEVVGLAMQLVWVSGLGLLRMLQLQRPPYVSICRMGGTLAAVCSRMGGTAAAAYALGFMFAAGVGLAMQLVWGFPNTYAGADICWRMLTYGGHCSYSIRMRVLTYADVC